MKFYIGRIPVKIYPMFWFLIIAIGWLSTFSLPETFIWAIVILISVVIHELGHALTATAFGQSTRIELYGMGGLTHRHGPKLKLWQEFLIVLNGPIAGFLLYLIAYKMYHSLAVPSGDFVKIALDVAIKINLFWTLVNLLPILPLDGGHLMRIMFEAVFGLRGVKIAYFLSMLISGIIGLLFFNTGVLIAGALFIILAFESFRIWKSTLSLTNQDQDVALQLKLSIAEREMRLGHVNDALYHFEEIRGMVKEGMIYTVASEHIAEILAHQNKFREAFEILYPLRSKIKPDMLRMLHQIAYRSGKWQEAITLGNQSFQYIPSYDTAVINALCHAILGEAVPAIGWLRCAIEEGLPNANEILEKREFDHIRDEPGFQELLNS
jgi:Zn-dependent protease